MSEKKAIIFGGSGFIGTHLFRKLKDAGYVRLVSADICEPKKPVDGVEYINCDVRNPINFNEHFDEAYNFAAVHTTPGHEDHEYYDTNVAGAINIVKFCEENKVDNLIFTSSIAVYGPDEEQKIEDTPTKPISAYGKSKFMAELIHKKFIENASNKKLVIVRPAVVYGEMENGNFTRLAKAINKKCFFYPGRKNTLKSCIYVKDLINSMEFALLKLNETNQNLYLYNGAISPVPHIEEICNTFSEVLDKPKVKIVVPLKFMKFASLPFMVLNKVGVYKNGICPERMDKLVKSTNIFPKKLENDNFEYQYTIESSLKEWKKATNFE